MFEVLKLQSNFALRRKVFNNVIVFGVHIKFKLV